MKMKVTQTNTNVTQPTISTQQQSQPKPTTTQPQAQQPRSMLGQGTSAQDFSRMFAEAFSNLQAGGAQGGKPSNYHV